VVAKKTEKKEQPKESDDEKESDEKGLGLEMDLEDM